VNPKPIITRVLWWALLIESALFLSVARFFILFLPFRYWRRSLGDLEGDVDGALATSAVLSETEKKSFRRARRIAAAITRIAPLLPFKAICLPRAIALKWMLALRLQPSGDIHYCVRFADDGKLEAHAWLSLHGQTVIGHHDGSFAALARHSRSSPQ